MHRRTLSALLALDRAQRKARRRNSITSTLTLIELAIVFERQSGKCNTPDCDTPLRHSASIDHVKPVARRGRADISNIQLLCFHCNHRKGSRRWQEFLRLRDRERHPGGTRPKRAVR